MQVALQNNVQVFNLTAGKTLPEWLAAKKKSKRSGTGLSAADERRVELIHDFEFPDFARTVFRTANGSFLFAAGDYPPRLKCFDVNDMSVKFTFNADMAIEGGVSLSPDFRKFALRGEGRTITVHNAGNVVDRVRVPHTQRSMIYHEQAAELLSAGNSHELFRINLDQGRFVESFKTASDGGVNAISSFTSHGLILAGCENGTVEAFDPRQGNPAGVLRVEGVEGVDEGASVRSLATDATGMVVAAGSSTGQVSLFDVRLNRPLLVKDHMTSLPIVKVAMYRAASNEETHVLSADTRALRIWDRGTGRNFTTIDAPATIYDFVVMRSQHNLAPPHECSDSGVVALCCDTPKIQVHFIPSLGPAPRWAGFLDTLTEEMHEAESTAVYEDYKFITKAEADTLGLSATEVSDGRVRPAMHGVYVENRLYRELKAVADPQGYERMLEANRRGKRREAMADRISKFHRQEPAAAAAGAEGLPSSGARSMMTAGSAVTKAGMAKADASSAMMRSLTPQAIELLQRDPRFASKMGLDRFKLDKEHPDFARFMNQLKDQQEKAERRRARYDKHQFRVVEDSDTDVAAAAASSSPLAAADDAVALLKPAAARRASRDTPPAAESDGVQMLESRRDAGAFGATDRQSHEARKVKRAKALTVAERLAKARKAKR